MVVQVLGHLLGAEVIQLCRRVAHLLTLRGAPDATSCGKKVECNSIGRPLWRVISSHVRQTTRLLHSSHYMDRIRTLLSGMEWGSDCTLIGR